MMKNNNTSRGSLFLMPLIFGFGNYLFSSGSVPSVDEVHVCDPNQTHLRVARLETVVATGNIQPTQQNIVNEQQKALDQAAAACLPPALGAQQTETIPVSRHRVSQPIGSYLFLPDLPGKEKYVVSMCPMNSSGDAYHILAYIILAMHHGKMVPTVILTHDEDDTKTSAKQNTKIAAERTLCFAEMLGFDQHFEKNILWIDPRKSAETGNLYEKKTTRSTARQNNLIWTLAKPPLQYNYFIDQKALTTLIAQHCFIYGKVKTQRMLLDGFSKRNANYAVYQAVDDDARAETEKILNHAQPDQPLMIIHARNSKYANEQNTMSEEEVTALSAYFERHSWAFWVICIEGEDNGLYNKLHGTNKTSPFNYQRTKQGFGMLYHLRLMSNLRRQNHDIKVIGNTSGALDLVAFLGHDVYNLQTWNGGMTYQYVRLLIGSAFLTVEFIQSMFWDALRVDGSATHLSKLNAWHKGLQIPGERDEGVLRALIKKALPYTGGLKQKPTGTEIFGYIELANTIKLSDKTLSTLPDFKAVMDMLPYVPASPETQLSILSNHEWEKIYEQAKSEGMDPGTVTTVRNQVVEHGFPGDKSYERVLKILKEIESAGGGATAPSLSQYGSAGSSPSSWANNTDPAGSVPMAPASVTNTAPHNWVRNADYADNAAFTPGAGQSAPHQAPAFHYTYAGESSATAAISSSMGAFATGWNTPPISRQPSADQLAAQKLSSHGNWKSKYDQADTKKREKMTKVINFANGQTQLKYGPQSDTYKAVAEYLSSKV
ncbi:MAG: hypothetical protein Q8K36_06520 [Alphaproteobacteria bacterium]|nr:hypothetical protein [Alphaproteobacteria bacterium]